MYAMDLLIINNYREKTIYSMFALSGKRVMRGRERKGVRWLTDRNNISRNDAGKEEKIRSCQLRIYDEHHDYEGSSSC